MHGRLANMRRPAVLHFGLALLAACWSGNSVGSATPGPTLEASTRDLTGPYWCSIDDAGFEYPRYPCVIRKVGDKLMLAKLGGSQRIRGNIVLDKHDGFTFVGELYCPWGDCTEQMRGRFRPAGKGGFKAMLNGPLDHDGDAGMIVQLVPAPADAFGGNGYGGDGYGDPFGYGGASYGGAGYGYYRIDRRGRRRP